MYESRLPGRCGLWPRRSLWRSAAGTGMFSRVLKLAMPAATVAVLLAAQACGADPDALRHIVQEECVPHWVGQHDAAPCVEVQLSDSSNPTSGFALLADRKGGAHFLLIPTRRITGIESSELLAPDAPNYFAAAWEARGHLEPSAGHVVPRNAVGLAVNPVRARSQTQLHIHIECLRPDLFDALNRDSARISDVWTQERVGAAEFEALKVSGEVLGDRNPFKMLNQRASEQHRAMGDYTLIVAGTQSSGGPGFILLASTVAAGELLLDSSCAVLKAS